MSEEGVQLIQKRITKIDAEITEQEANRDQHQEDMERAAAKVENLEQERADLQADLQILTT